MTNQPYDPNQGEGVSPWAVPAYDTPASGYPQVQQQPYPQPQPPQSVPQQNRFPQDQYDQSGFPRPGQPQPQSQSAAQPMPTPMSTPTQPGVPPMPADFPQGAYGLSPYGTAPNVHGYGPLNVTLASWGLRVGATLLDFLVVSPLLIGGLVALFRSFTAATYDASGNVVKLSAPTGHGIFILLLCYAGVFAVSLWQLYRQGTTGQTLGKKAVGIRVLKHSSLQPTGFGGAFVRTLAHLVDSLPLGAGYLAPLWDSNNKTFADQICGTLVIRG